MKPCPQKLVVKKAKAKASGVEPKLVMNAKASSSFIGLSRSESQIGGASSKPPAIVSQGKSSAALALGGIVEAEAAAPPPPASSSAGAVERGNLIARSAKPKSGFFGSMRGGASSREIEAKGKGPDKEVQIVTTAL